MGARFHAIGGFAGPGPIARASVPTLVCLGAALSPGACAPVQGGPRVAESARPTAAADVSGPSLFAYPWTWTDERGQRVALSRWRGQTLVVSAVYATCRATCPRTIAKLQKIEADFQRNNRAAQFLLVTLDPVSDTPDVLRRFKQESGFPDSWHLLAGSVQATRELTDILDIHIIDDGPHLMHDAKIVVFDAAGRPTRRFGGWALDDETRLSQQ
jgi:protein SCO1/2